MNSTPPLDIDRDTKIRATQKRIAREAITKLIQQFSHDHTLKRDPRNKKVIEDLQRQIENQDRLINAYVRQLDKLGVENAAAQAVLSTAQRQEWINNQRAATEEQQWDLVLEEQGHRILKHSAQQIADTLSTMKVCLTTIKVLDEWQAALDIEKAQEFDAELAAIEAETDALEGDLADVQIEPPLDPELTPDFSRPGIPLEELTAALKTAGVIRDPDPTPVVPGIKTFSEASIPDYWRRPEIKARLDSLAESDS